MEIILMFILLSEIIIMSFLTYVGVKYEKDKELNIGYFFYDFLLIWTIQYIIYNNVSSAKNEILFVAFLMFPLSLILYIYIDELWKYKFNYRKYKASTGKSLLLPKKERKEIKEIKCQIKKLKKLEKNNLLITSEKNKLNQLKDKLLYRHYN